MAQTQPDPKHTQDAALYVSEETFRLLVDSVQDYSIYMLDEKGVVTTWNAGAERAKGYHPKEIIGQHFSRFYTPGDIENRRPQKNLEIARREGHCLDEGWRVRKDGTRFWASVVITAVKDKEGNFKGFAKVTRDMSERKQAEDELERKVRDRTLELAQRNKELEQFAYVASHDLQEPLRVVATYIDLLGIRAAAKLDEEDRKFMRYAVDGAERAQQLIREVLEFSQIGIKTKNFKPVDLNLTLQSVLANLKVSLEETRAQVEAGPLPVMTVDGSQIFQLFLNLIGNAVKYRGTAPLKIKVSAQEEPDFWTFAVQDNGIGIETMHHQKIFELFQRLHSKNKYPGTGLGLAICKKIVEHHQGQIWVESEAGQGSTFKFRLPKRISL